MSIKTEFSPKLFLRIQLVLVLLALFISPPASAARKFDHSHALFAKVLQAFVREGLVDYRALIAHPQDLDDYLDQLAALKETEFQRWTRSEQLACLINLYNAQTLRLILDHYPLKSIKDIGGFFKGPWDQPVVRLWGRRMTLGDLEHKVLRKDYDEPRIHFALVCAARGCPPLRNEPYLSAVLEEQLEEQERIFMATTHKNSLDPVRRVVRLSPIFDWFKEDFIKKYGSVFAFVSDYFPASTGRDLVKAGYNIEYTDYDWTLNEARGP